LPDHRTVHSSFYKIIDATLVDNHAVIAPLLLTPIPEL
jgi:hypothetical protein